VLGCVGDPRDLTGDTMRYQARQQWQPGLFHGWHFLFAFWPDACQNSAETGDQTKTPGPIDDGAGAQKTDTADRAAVIPQAHPRTHLLLLTRGRETPVRKSCSPTGSGIVMMKEIHRDVQDFPQRA
ncbi:MAG: hypothetical protein ACPG48_06130, partial [Candidatus Puniceispirillaceae bacterium]